MQSSRTTARIKRRKLINDIIINMLSVVQMSDNELEKIQLASLMNIKLSTENFKKWVRADDRYMHDTYISANGLDE